MTAGFSAGGHLAANLGVAWQESFLDGLTGTVREQRKPNGQILGYPVISSEPWANQETTDHLLGPCLVSELLEAVSLERHVTGQTPPPSCGIRIRTTRFRWRIPSCLLPLCEKRESPWSCTFIREAFMGWGWPMRRQRTYWDWEYSVNARIGLTWRADGFPVRWLLRPGSSGAAAGAFDRTKDLQTF